MACSNRENVNVHRKEIFCDNSSDKSCIKLVVSKAKIEYS